MESINLISSDSKIFNYILLQIYSLALSECSIIEISDKYSL